MTHGHLNETNLSHLLSLLNAHLPFASGDAFLQLAGTKYIGASGIRVGKSTRLPAKSQGLGSGSGSIPMMRLWECGNLAFCSRFPHFHSPCSTATRFRHADRRRPPRLGEHRSGRPTGRPPGGTESTGRTRPATRAGSTHPKAGRANTLQDALTFFPSPGNYRPLPRTAQSRNDMSLQSYVSAFQSQPT